MRALCGSQLACRKQTLKTSLPRLYKMQGTSFRSAAGICRSCLPHCPPARPRLSRRFSLAARLLRLPAAAMTVGAVGQATAKYSSIFELARSVNSVQQAALHRIYDFSIGHPRCRATPALREKYGGCMVG